MREKDEHAITPLCCVSRVARTDARVEQKVNKREGVESYVWLLHREQQATTSSYPITSQYTLRQRGERAHSCWRSVTDFFFLTLFSSLHSPPPPSFPLHPFVISSSCCGRVRRARPTSVPAASSVSPAAGPWHIHGAIYNTSTRNRVFKVARRWSGCGR